MASLIKEEYYIILYKPHELRKFRAITGKKFDKGIIRTYLLEKIIKEK